MELFSHEKINDRLYRISLPGNVFAYLAVGEKKAMLIDTGFGIGSLKTYINENITSLPMFLYLTHGHLDHAGGASEFDEVYLNHGDLELAKEHTSLEKRRGALGDLSEELLLPPLPLEKYLPLNDGDEFDLGGMTVVTRAMFGHTAGSVCPLFKEDRVILLGDACNSLGFLQLDCSLPLHKYRDSLEKFLMYENEFDTVLFSHPHNFGDKSIVRATYELCCKVIDGEVKGVPKDGNMMAKPTDEKDRPLDGSCANFIYRLNNI
ncbi:MAG: MBL fold metallo-hydrolase [Lachnospiraceae bacterium]|nr:MBL fold metallo-hydrolase [Lachnospiraceae bacterium]